MEASPDLVQVVRCRDCKYYKQHYMGDWYCDNDNFPSWEDDWEYRQFEGFGPDGYCSYGVRSTPEDELREKLDAQIDEKRRKEAQKDNPFGTLKDYYDQELLENSRVKPIYANFFRPPLPKEGQGKPVVWKKTIKLKRARGVYKLKQLLHKKK